MKFFFAISLLAFTLHPFLSFGQTVDPNTESARLKSILEQYHIQPRAIDDNFSRFVFDETVHQLDPDRLFLTNEDLLPLAPFRNSLDEEWKENRSGFRTQLAAIFEKSLNRSITLLQETGKTRINWSGADIWEDGNTAGPVDNTNLLKTRYSVWLKYKIMIRLADRFDQDSTIRNVTLSMIQGREAEEKDRVVQAMLRKIRQTLNTQGGVIFKVASVMLKSVTAAFDPHSQYLSPQEAESFMGALSSRDFSLGLELNEDAEGDISIERLVPGGPAWKSGELHQNDVLVSVKPDGQSLVNLTGAGLEEFSRLLDGSHAAIELTVRASNGVNKTVRLREEKMDDDNNIVKGFVLHGKNTIGYVSLPGFYSDWGSLEGSGCANDMATQILKLKRENIQGLILDIRSNGGGSVPEAIELAGIFIDEGPLALYRGKDGVIATLKDVNRGTIYDGPLILLIDGRSASAAELLAAALQDYHRAFILGTRSFGKATGQRILSLDPSPPASHSQQKAGYGTATVTFEKLYRVTGKSVQGNGIDPDIVIPDIYDGLSPHEADLPGALARDSVTKKVFIKERQALPLQALRTKSQERITADPKFRFLKATNAALLAGFKKHHSQWPLNWEKYFNTPPIALADKSLTRNLAITSITVTDFGRTTQTRSAFDKESNDRLIQHLKDDECVSEAFQVMGDYLALKK